jgi:hypothetical protein
VFRGFFVSFVTVLGIERVSRSRSLRATSILCALLAGGLPWGSPSPPLLRPFIREGKQSRTRVLSVRSFHFLQAITVSFFQTPPRVSHTLFEQHLMELRKSYTPKILDVASQHLIAALRTRFPFTTATHAMSDKQQHPPLLQALPPRLPHPSLEQCLLQ